jgi:hypothetical protein
MSGDDLQKLLGGYATGTLSEAERKSLFEAALHDQALFDAMADEEALRELLRDSSARDEILTALSPAPKVSWWQKWVRHPAGWAGAVSVAAAAGVIVLMLAPWGTRQPNKEIALVQQVESRAAQPAERPQPSKFEVEAKKESARRPARSISDRKLLTDRMSEPTAAAPRAAAEAPPPKNQGGAAPAGGVAANLVEEGAAALPPPKAEADSVLRSPPNPAPAVTVAPSDPMSAVATFRQTAPGASADAVELRAEKARGELSLRALQKAARPVPAAVAAAVPAIRYELQQRGAQNLYARIDPDLPLGTAAPLRLEAETNRPGYLYAFEADAGGAYRQLSIGPTVDAHVKHTVELGEPAPDRKVLLVFSERPVAEFSVGSTTEGALGVLNRLRSYRPLLRQKSANSVYVTGASGTPAMLLEIALPASK